MQAQTFTVTVSNAGPSSATNVVVQDSLPAGLTFVSSTPSQGTFDSATGRWSVSSVPGQGSFDNATGIWTVGSLANGASATLMITASVDTLGLKSNVVQVSAADQFDIDSTPNNSNATEDDQASVLIIPPRTLSKRAFLAR